MSRGQVHVNGRRVDVVVAHQRLDNSQVDAGFGHGSAQRYLYLI
jgi:hypothetical protein